LPGRQVGGTLYFILSISEAILITGGNGANGGLNEAALFRLYFPEFKVAT